MSIELPRLTYVFTKILQMSVFFTHLRLWVRLTIFFNVRPELFSQKVVTNLKGTGIFINVYQKQTFKNKLICL